MLTSTSSTCFTKSSQSISQSNTCSQFSTISCVLSNFCTQSVLCIEILNQQTFWSLKIAPSRFVILVFRDSLSTSRKYQPSFPRTIYQEIQLMKSTKRENQISQKINPRKHRKPENYLHMSNQDGTEPLK